MPFCCRNGRSDLQQPQLFVSRDTDRDAFMWEIPETLQSAQDAALLLMERVNNEISDTCDSDIVSGG